MCVYNDSQEADAFIGSKIHYNKQLHTHTKSGCRIGPGYGCCCCCCCLMGCVCVGYLPSNKSQKSPLCLVGGAVLQRQWQRRSAGGSGCLLLTAEHLECLRPSSTKGTRDPTAARPRGLGWLPILFGCSRRRLPVAAGAAAGAL